MKSKKRLSNTKIILLGFIIMILAGALLLLLPISTRQGQTTTPLGALFTSVSSVCVTGLVVYDTWSHWTLFGQGVLLVLIQVGGLGFITVGTFFMIAMGQRIGLSRRALIQDSLSTLQIRGSVKLIRRIIMGTVLFEGVGAVLLASRFVPLLGWERGIWYGIFHGVSAFCNAGFDLMGYWEPYSSFCSLQGDPVVILTLGCLIIIGGLGFVVWEDLYVHALHWRAYRFQTKAVLVTSGLLCLGGAVLFYVLERGGLFAPMTVGDKLLNAFFASVSPRTAGFNAVELSSLSNGGKLLTMFLMFVGGSPGSTAGGIKTTTLFASILYVKAYLLHEKDCVAFKTRMDADAIKKASVVILINLSLVIVGSLFIFAAQELPFTDVLFEVFSAGGTVGMSTGITRELTAGSRLVIMLLMYCGRMGSLTFAMSFYEHRRIKEVRYPEEQITVG